MKRASPTPDQNPTARVIFCDQEPDDLLAQLLLFIADSKRFKEAGENFPDTLMVIGGRDNVAQKVAFTQNFLAHAIEQGYISKEAAEHITLVHGDPSKLSHPGYPDLKPLKDDKNSPQIHRNPYQHVVISFIENHADCDLEVLCIKQLDEMLQIQDSLREALTQRGESPNDTKTTFAFYGGFNLYISRDKENKCNKLFKMLTSAVGTDNVLVAERSEDLSYYGPDSNIRVGDETGILETVYNLEVVGDLLKGTNKKWTGAQISTRYEWMQKTIAQVTNPNDDLKQRMAELLDFFNPENMKNHPYDATTGFGAHIDQHLETMKEMKGILKSQDYDMQEALKTIPENDKAGLEDWKKQDKAIKSALYAVSQIQKTDTDSKYEKFPDILHRVIVVGDGISQCLATDPAAVMQLPSMQTLLIDLSERLHFEPKEIKSFRRVVNNNEAGVDEPATNVLLQQGSQVLEKAFVKALDFAIEAAATRPATTAAKQRPAAATQSIGGGGASAEHGAGGAAR